MSFPEKTNKRHIAVGVCVDNRMAMHAAITLYSLAKNVHPDVHVNAYVLSAGFTEENRQRFDSVLDLDGITIHHRNLDTGLFSELPVASWTSPATHGRILLPGIVDESFGEILYLDSDMLVLCDVSRIFDIPFEGNCLKVCQDLKYRTLGTSRSSSVYDEFGLYPGHKYFNSGLLGINIDAWRREDLVSRYFELGKKLHGRLSHSDQDIMNLLFYRKCVWLPPEYNLFSRYYKEYRNTSTNPDGYTCIIHYTGFKPDDPRSTSPLRGLFYNYVKESGWFSRSEYRKWRITVLVKRIPYTLRRGFVSKKKCKSILRYSLKRLRSGAAVR
ncbi:MAG: glycosyltransferase family 8 protein [Gammaproteobacteria bacterium]|nr:glycosyltransferase family 8 protein [Gammaproteobacteria bacterium]